MNTKQFIILLTLALLSVPAYYIGRRVMTDHMPSVETRAIHTGERLELVAETKWNVERRVSLYRYTDSETGREYLISDHGGIVLDCPTD